MIWNNCKKNTDGSWLDLETGIEFNSNYNWTNKDSKNSFFISDQKNFVNGNRFDLNFINQYYGPFFENILDNAKRNTEIMYWNLPELQKFKHSKILVVGGGPSAKERDWNTDNYDYIFSCNHFFLN